MNKEHAEYIVRKVRGIIRSLAGIHIAIQCSLEECDNRSGILVLERVFARGARRIFGLEVPE